MKEYATEFPDGTLIRWRPLTWVEFKDLKKQYKYVLEKGGVAEWLLLEAAASLCILGMVQDDEPINNPDDLYAGVVSVVGRAILEETGFFSSPDLIEKKRNQARAEYLTDWYEEAKSYIMFLFRISERQINNWDNEKFMEYVVRAETILGQPFKVVRPGEEDEDDQPRFIEGPDGQQIPLLTKKDLQKKKQSNPDKDFEEMEKEGFHFRQRPAGMADIKKIKEQKEAETEKKEHPLRQKINQIHSQKRIKR